MDGERLAEERRSAARRRAVDGIEGGGEPAEVGSPPTHGPAVALATSQSATMALSAEQARVFGARERGECDAYAAAVTDRERARYALRA